MNRVFKENLYINRKGRPIFKLVLPSHKLPGKPLAQGRQQKVP